MKITIANSLISKLEDKIRKFKKKFEKYSSNAFIYSKSEPYICKDKTSKLFNYKVVDVEIEGSYQIQGFEFIAELEYNDECKLNLVKKAPNTPDIPKEFISRCSCDHCNISRRRKSTVLLKNTITNKYIQVGKSCLKDYLGNDIVNTALYLSFFDDVKKFEEIDFSSISSNDRYFSVYEVLTQTCAEVNKYSYISKNTIDNWYAKHEDSACPYTKTSTIIYYMFNKVRDENGNLIRDFYKISDVEIEMTAKIIDYINNHKEDSDYTRNLYILNNNAYVNNEDLGLLVSSVGYYLRETEVLKQAKESKSQYIGRIGEKILFRANAKLKNTFNTMYGDLHIYSFNYNDNELIWKTNKDIPCDKELIITGTIKAHNEYRGLKSTEITRCKIMEGDFALWQKKEC